MSEKIASQHNELPKSCNDVMEYVTAKNVTAEFDYKDGVLEINLADSGFTDAEAEQLMADIKETCPVGSISYFALQSSIYVDILPDEQN